MSLITQILTGVWLVTPEYKQGFLPIAARLINGGNLSFGEIKEHVKEREEKYKGFQSSIPSETGSYYSGFSSAPDERLGVVKMSGIMIKEGDASTYGTDSTYNLLKQAGENPAIITTVFQVNSGGGYSDSAANLFDLISNYEMTYGKPLVTLVDKMAGSAAFWAVSPSSKIILIGKDASVGSIGTKASWLDISEMLARQGIKEVTVYADESVDKGLISDSADAGDYQPLKEVLNHIQKQFKASVKSGRKENLNSEDVFTGKMYYGLNAIKAGLADDIMTREEAMQYAWRLGKKKKKY